MLYGRMHKPRKYANVTGLVIDEKGVCQESQATLAIGKSREMIWSLQKVTATSMIQRSWRSLKASDTWPFLSNDYSSIDRHSLLSSYSYHWDTFRI